LVSAYEPSGASGKLVLDVFADGSFTESIEDSKSSTVKKQTGTWLWSGGRISFENLWIPNSFAPEEIRLADSQSPQFRTVWSENGVFQHQPQAISPQPRFGA